MGLVKNKHFQGTLLGGTEEGYPAYAFDNVDNARRPVIVINRCAPTHFEPNMRSASGAPLGCW